MSRRATATPMPVAMLPTGDTLPDEDTDERHTALTLSDVEAAIDAKVQPIHDALASILAHVGPEAQRHRSRREATVYAIVTTAGGCFGIGALDQRGASDVTLAILGGLVLALAVLIAAVLGRVHVTAKAPGVSIGAGGNTDGSAP